MCPAYTAPGTQRATGVVRHVLASHPIQDNWAKQLDRSQELLGGGVWGEDGNMQDQGGVTVDMVDTLSCGKTWNFP